MEINKDHPERINKGYLFRTGSSKRVSHYHSHLAETQRQAEELQSFMVVEKKKGFRCSLSGGPGPGEARRRVTRRGASYVVGWGVNLAFASKTSLVLSWK